MLRTATTALVLLLCCAPAAAQEAPAGALPLPELPALDLAQPCAPDVPEERRRALISRGSDAGVWFHLSLAQCMIGRLTVLPLYVDRVRLLEQRIEAQQRIEDTITTAELLSRQMADEAVAALTAAERGRREAEEELGAWYRHPVLWFSAGAVVVLAILIGILAGT